MADLEETGKEPEKNSAAVMLSTLAPSGRFRLIMATSFELPA